MSSLGTVHFVFSLAALAFGAWVLLIRKGTRWHRTVGHLYATSMVGLNVTALFLYRMTGRFGPFHVFALVALVTLGLAMYTVLFRRPRDGWMEAHATWMAWSYIGLCAAAVSETATRLLMPVLAPRLSGWTMGAFWGTVALGTLAVILVGRKLIAERLPDSLARTPASMRQEREALAG